MSESTVRPVNYDDLEPLVAALGDEVYFRDRFDRHKGSLGVLLSAWTDGRPVGHVYLWLEEAEEPPIRQWLPRVPLLTHLEVLPEHRNRGIGTRLIAEVEEQLRTDGHDKVALAVRTDNGLARRLYERLGYCDWGHGEVVCQAERHLPDGTTELEPETCHVLVKGLGADAPSVHAAEVVRAGR